MNHEEEWMNKTDEESNPITINQCDLLLQLLKSLHFVSFVKKEWKNLQDIPTKLFQWTDASDNYSSVQSEF